MPAFYFALRLPNTTLLVTNVNYWVISFLSSSWWREELPNFQKSSMHRSYYFLIQHPWKWLGPLTNCCTRRCHPRPVDVEITQFTLLAILLLSLSHPLSHKVLSRFEKYNALESSSKQLVVLYHSVEAMVLTIATPVFSYYSHAKRQLPRARTGNWINSSQRLDLLQYSRSLSRVFIWWRLVPDTIVRILLLSCIT